MKPDYLSYTLEDYICDESFQRWTKSQSSKEETQHWNQFLESHPEKQEIINLARVSILKLTHTEWEVDPVKVNKAWHQLESEISTPVRKLPIGRFLSYAAMLFLVVSSVIYFTDPAEQSPADYLTYQSDFGEKKEVSLPDGSLVILNANSIIRISGDWKASGREVWLESGEAFFEVSKTKDQQKFVVHTQDFDVNVLGTQFNINIRSEEPNVLLTEGKVALTHNEKVTIMAPGELAIVTKNKIEVAEVNIGKYNTWLRNSLTFNNTSLKRVTEILEGHYGVTFELPEELATRQLSGEIPNDNLGMVLDALGLTLNLKMVRNNNTVVISKNAL